MWRGIYELGDKLAEGGFSSVYMAVKQKTNEKFVLKKIDMKDIVEVDEVQFEAKQLIPLSHINIVSYEDDFIHIETNSLETKYSYILIMEYCNGGDLTDKIRNAYEDNSPFTENQLMEYFCQLLLAVKYIHDRDVIHRDIKSPNLFLSDEHYLKLGDFGLSTKGRSVQDKSCISRVGTDCYMAPEVRDGSYEGSSTSRSGEKMQMTAELNLKPSDIWWIGLILYEMVTLVPIWDLKFDITLKLYSSESSEVWSWLEEFSNYDRQVINIIKKCLKLDPKERPTIDQILKMNYIKKHLKYLEKNKKNMEIEILRSSEGSQNWSKQPSSEKSYAISEEMDQSEISFHLEDQGAEIKENLKMRKRKK